MGSSDGKAPVVSIPSEPPRPQLPDSSDEAAGVPIPSKPPVDSSDVDSSDVDSSDVDSSDAERPYVGVRSDVDSSDAEPRSGPFAQVVVAEAGAGAMSVDERNRKRKRLWAVDMRNRRRPFRPQNGLTNQKRGVSSAAGQCLITLCPRCRAHMLFHQQQQAQSQHVGGLFNCNGWACHNAARSRGQTRSIPESMARYTCVNCDIDYCEVCASTLRLGSGSGGGGSGGGGGDGGSDGGNGGKGHWSGGGGGDSGAGNGGKGNGSNNLPGSDAAEGVRTLSALLEGTPRALHARCGNMWRMQVNALHVQGNALVVQGKKLAYAMMDPNSQLSRLENKGLPAVRKTAEFRGKCFPQDCYIPLAVGVKAEGKGPQWGVITEVWRLAATYGTILPTVEELDKQNWNGSIVGVLRFSSSSKRGTPEWVANGRWCEETEGWDVANHIDPERSQCLENFKQSVWADSKKDRPAGPEAKILPDVLADIQRQVLRLTALRTLKSPLFLYLPTSPPTPTSGQNHPTETETSKREKLKTSVERHLLVYMLAHDGVHEVIGLDSHLLLVPVDVAEMILCRSLVYGQTALPLDSLGLKVIRVCYN